MSCGREGVTVTQAIRSGGAWLVPDVLVNEKVRTMRWWQILDNHAVPK